MRLQKKLARRLARTLDGHLVPGDIAPEFLPVTGGLAACENDADVMPVIAL